MDLPGYPCPPRVRDIPTHAGTWGWIFTADVSQDDEGYLWVKGDAIPTPTAEIPKWCYSLAVWTEDGLALYVHPQGYGLLRRIKGTVDKEQWVPVASVLKEPSGYAIGRPSGSGEG